jgi:hypothetical protein
MKYHDFHLTDVTQEFFASSEPPVTYVPPRENRLDVTPPTATVGQKYRLAVSGLRNAEVTVHYTLDGGPVRAFKAHLDDHGEVTFEISPSTQKGLYKFVGFSRAGINEWFQATSSIRID